MEDDQAGSELLLPKINIYTLLDYCSSNQVSAGHGTKNFFTSLQNDTNHITQMHCDHSGFNYTIKCTVNSDGQVHNCLVNYNEDTQVIENAMCSTCGTEANCKSVLSLLICLHQANQDPIIKKEPSDAMDTEESTELGLQFIRAKDFFKPSEVPEIPTCSAPDRTGVLCQFLKECKKRNVRNLLTSYFFDKTSEEKASLHYLICQYKSEASGHNIEDFIAYLNKNITTEQVNQVELATRKRIDFKLWEELKYGRITASMIYEASNKLNSENLVDRIIASYLFKDAELMIKRKALKLKILNVIAKLKKISIQNCGLMISQEYPMLCASPTATSGRHVIVIKGVNDKQYLENGNLQEKYVAQIQIHMHLANKKRGYFCVPHKDFASSEEVDIFTVAYDENYCKQLTEKAFWFWKINVYDKISLGN